jgi:hypothetical protein
MASVIAEMEVRNSSGHDLDIPVDPSSRDLEPASPSTPYRYQTTYIWLVAEPGARETMPTRGLFLYGSKTVPNSMRTLAPGQALRIRAILTPGGLSHEAPENTTRHTEAVRAFLSISNNSVTVERDGSLHSHTEQAVPTVSSFNMVEVPR